MTAQGHPRRIFATAIERGNIVMAETTARELGRISLEEALALTALVAEKEPERRSRFAVRWLRRLLQEDESLTIEEATMAASCLSALGGPSHERLTGCSRPWPKERLGMDGLGGGNPGDRLFLRAVLVVRLDVARRRIDVHLRGPRRPGSPGIFGIARRGTRGSNIVRTRSRIRFKRWVMVKG